MATALQRLLLKWLNADITAKRPVFPPGSGRWLWNEKKTIAQHTVKFDSRALRAAAAKSMDVDNVTLEFVAEGASNKVFRVRAPGQHAIIKLPDPFLSPGLVTASEAATMRYLREELGLPVPEVLDWSCTADNEIGSEYILMAEAEGQSLRRLWDGYDVEERISVVDQLVTIQQRLVEGGARVKGYGSLYLTEDAISLGLRHQELANEGQKRTGYSLGPLAQIRQAKAFEGSSGPCKFLDTLYFSKPDISFSGQSPQEQMTGICDIAIEKVKNGTYSASVFSSPRLYPTIPSGDTSIEASLTLLEQYRNAIPQLVSQFLDNNPDPIARAALWHPDLHLGNMCVARNGRISSVIDWQSVAVQPLVYNTQLPSFLWIRDGIPVYDLPENLQLLDMRERTKVMERYHQTTLRDYYLAKIQRDIPGCWKCMSGQPDQAEQPDYSLPAILRSLLASVTETFDRETDTIMLRSNLIFIQKNWERLTAEGNGDPKMPCPFSFDEDTINRHKADGQLWNKYYNLLLEYGIPVLKDGWVYHLDFVAGRARLKSFIEEVSKIFETAEQRQAFQNKVQTWNVTRWR